MAAATLLCFTTVLLDSGAPVIRLQLVLDVGTVLVILILRAVKFFACEHAFAAIYASSFQLILFLKLQIELLVL